MSRKFHFALAAAIAVSLVGCSGPPADVPPASIRQSHQARFEDIRRHVAALHEQVTEPSIVKWTDPVRYRIVEVKAPQGKELIRRHLSTIHQLTGLDVTEVDESSSPNLLFVLTEDFVGTATQNDLRPVFQDPNERDAAFRERLRRAASSAAIKEVRRDGIGIIRVTWLINPVKYAPEAFEESILRAVYHSFVGNGRSDFIRPSVVNRANSGLRRLAEIDVAYLKAYYAADILYGMPAAAARQILTERVTAALSGG